MSGRPRICATSQQEAELRDLAASARRAEADRARAILLSLEGWPSEKIAAAFGVEAATVRQWRWLFGRNGVAGLRERIAPGPQPVKAQAALAVVERLLCEPVADRTNWTLPRLQDEIARQTGVSISRSRLSVVMRQKGGIAGGGPGTA